MDIITLNRALTQIDFYTTDMYLDGFKMSYDFYLNYINRNRILFDVYFIDMSGQIIRGVLNMFNLSIEVTTFGGGKYHTYPGYYICIKEVQHEI